MIYLDILLIAAIIVLIIDISGAGITYQQIVAYFLKINDYKKIKKLCSLCITWWCCLTYIILTNQLTIFNVFYILLIACLTPQIQDILRLSQEIITKITNKIYEILE